jgi:hypothetical protein
MSAEWIYTRLLSDPEMSTHLEKRDGLLFKGLGEEWQTIERQVERLGFGDAYVVSQRGLREGHTKVTPVEAR